MANAIRLRTNFISGLTSDNPLSSGATTLNSSALANLPAVDSSHHALIILDPDGVNGAPEIVSVTAHTASATSATIVRAQEGTSARSHTQNTTWRHGALVSDYGLTVEEVDGTPSVLVRKLILPNGSLTDNSDDSVTFGPKAHGCRLYHDTTQSVSNSTDTRALFNSEDDDTDAYHSTSSNTSRITIPSGLDGVYVLSAGINFAGNGTGARYTQFYKNGAVVNGGESLRSGVASPDQGDVISTILRLAAGDYVEVNVYQTSGGNLNIGSTTGNAYAYNTFSAYFLGI